MKRTAVIVAILAAVAGDARSENDRIDLRLRTIPPPPIASLAMRGNGDGPIFQPRETRKIGDGPVFQVRETRGEASPATSPRSAAPGGVGAAARATAEEPTEATDGGEYRALPESWRDVEERVIFRVNAGYGLDSAATSGDVARSGVAPDDVTDPYGNRYAATRQYLLGDAVLGSRGVLVPSLNTYLLAQYSLDAGGDTFSAFPGVYDARDGRAVLVHSAYAEVEGIGGPGTPLDKLFVRAGRQYRHGGARFISHFDGVTAAYDVPAFELSGFVGRRVALFLDDDPGLLGGAGLALRGRDLAGVPVDLSVDYLRFDGDRSYLELVGRVGLPGEIKLALFGRAVDHGAAAGMDEEEDEGDGDAGGFGLGRLGARARAPVGHRLFVTAEVERIFAREAAYDYINPVPVDVVTVGEELGPGLALDRGADETRVGATAMALVTRSIEAYGFARASLVADGGASGFVRPYREGGGAARLLLGRRASASGQYKLRLHELDADANEAGTAFGDTGGSGVSSFHEVSGELRYSLGHRKATAAAGAYLRVYALQTPYAEVSNDTRGGGRFDVQWWATKMFRIRASGEVAQASPAYARELGLLASVRVLAEASF
jgi:hypothetical protein